jgi:hypothetical protein
LKKKHTIPNYKLRYKPFFPKSEPGEELEEATECTPGTLQVTVIEVTRLMADLVEGDIYCSLAVGEQFVGCIVFTCSLSMLADVSKHNNMCLVPGYSLKPSYCIISIVLACADGTLACTIYFVALFLYPVSFLP